MQVEEVKKKKEALEQKLSSMISDEIMKFQDECNVIVDYAYVYNYINSLRLETNKEPFCMRTGVRTEINILL